MTTNGDPTAPEPEDHEARITNLERSVARLQDDATTTRALASMADRDVSEWRETLRHHTQQLNVLRQTQVEQGALLNRLELRLDRLSDRVDDRFASVDLRLDSVDQRLDAMDQRFDAMDQRFDSVDRQLEQLVTAVNRLADGR